MTRIPDGVMERAGILAETTREVRDEKARIAWLATRLVGRRAAGHPEIRGVVLGGSYPKDTWLPDSADIDVFLEFEKATPRGDFDRIAREVGFAALAGFGPYERYSEHPFVEASVRGVRINVVPCFGVEAGEWQSAADRTPFHTRLMLERLTVPMRREVRLLKLFLRSNGLYGSEIARQGFSGYVAEVLVLYLGSFAGVVKKFAGAAPGMTLGGDPGRFETPVVIIDPVDPGRNLAAAISVENVGRFVLLCRAFLGGPSAEYFEPRPGRQDAKILDGCVTVRFRCGKRSPDVVWGQLRGAAAAVSAQLKLGGFAVVRSGALLRGEGRCTLFFLLESVRISEYRARRGPPFHCESDSERFLSRNYSRSSLMWVDGDGRVCSLERRRESDAASFLGRLLTEGLAASGVPAGVREDVAAGFEVRAGAGGLPEPIKGSLAESLSTDASMLRPS